MNVLPVEPRQVRDEESRSNYFDDLERTGFDVACSVHDAHIFDDVVGSLRGSYEGFASEARRRGFPACIKMQSTICAGDRVGIAEAQYDADNEPVRVGETGFLASFASREWRGYLKELVSIFVRDYGYEWVIFSEPVNAVDIPGKSDRFREFFAERRPDVTYPEQRGETAEYLTLQGARADIVVDFFTDMVAHAKSVGAQRIGLMPRGFTPTAAGTPPDTLNPACDIGAVARIEGLDFLVTSMGADSVFDGSARTGDELSGSPKLLYTEVLAHAQGKDVIASAETSPKSKSGLSIPAEFERDSLLSSLAAAPCGFSRYWTEGDDNALAIEAASFAGRLGNPVSPIAFVFSCTGTRHAQPYDYGRTFGFYWALVRKLALEARVPLLTFHANTLGQNLTEHPEVQVLVFEEHFPLVLEQMIVVRKWWQGPLKKAVVAFGAGRAYSADPEAPGEQPCSSACPGVLEVIGLSQEEDEPQYEQAGGVRLRDVSRVRRSAFLGDDLLLPVEKVANVRRVFGSRAHVIYETEKDDQKIPVVAEWRDRATVALFCGFGLSEATSSAARKAIEYVLREVDNPVGLVDKCSQGLIWSVNTNDYITISNLSNEDGSALVHTGRAHLWDCREGRLIENGEVPVSIPANSFRVFRVIGRRCKFMDILGVMCLRKLIDGAGRAEISILAGRKTTLVLRTSPKEIVVDGKSSTITQEVIDGVYHVTPHMCPPGERHISLRW